MSFGDKIERQLPDKCFRCGRENPIGLKFIFRREELRAPQ